MKKHCKFCGCEVDLKPPSDVDHKYEQRELWRYSKSKWLIYDKEGNVIAEWIAKEGIGSWNGRCICGKRVFHIEEQIPPEKTIQAFRSNIDNKKVVKAWHDKLYLFELGKHWPPFINDELKSIIPNIRDNNQLELFN